MILTDTHTHLYLEDFKDDIDEVILRARELGVGRFVLPNVDRSTYQDMMSLVAKYPGICFPMIGLHPCSVKENYMEELSFVEEMLHSGEFYGIGEIGIDLYWDKTNIEAQKNAFALQINMAKNLELPIVIHCRESFNEIFEVLERLNDEKLRGIFHCFTGNLEQAVQIINYGGFKLGIGGVITFKNSGLDKTIEHIGLEHVVLETDAPYLAPVPYRGKRNESSYILEAAKKLAEIKGVSIEEIALRTTENAEDVFNIKNKG